MTYRCFELDPNHPKDVKENIYEKLSQKYGMSVEQAKANIQNMVQMAKEVGLDYQMDTQILTNTFDAHRLTMFAKTKGLMPEMTERILRAHFTESKHIGDHDTLVELATSVGLDRDETAKMLASDDMADEVRADEQAAKDIRVTGVPYFLFNKKYSLTGAQPTDVFVKAIREVLNEE